NHATAGETIHVQGLVFNDTPNAMDWQAPETIVLQWRSERGTTLRSIANLTSGTAAASIPVNSFARFQWRAVVPQGATGLQAVNVEGDSTLLALDTSLTAGGLVAAAPADGPVLDAGKGDPMLGDPIASDQAVAHAGATHAGGPSPVTPLGSAPNPGLARFPSAVSPDDPQHPSFLDGLYLGYTQTSLWDLHSDSHPFIDTSFKPSLFWRRDALLRADGSPFYLGFQGGVEHESNGKSGDDSRALNFAYVQPEFNYRFGGGSTLSFTPRYKQYFSIEENPDYKDYVGKIDWRLRWAQDDGLVLTGLYRRGKGGRESTQLEAAWPLKRTFLNMNGYLYAQYF